MDACKLLVHTLVMVRLDYCNALHCGPREDVIRQLERLQRKSARVVCKKYKNDHTSVTELMWGLHWLPIRARIQYKILLHVYKAFTNGSPTYLTDMMTSCNPVRSTRSSHLRLRELANPSNPPLYPPMIIKINTLNMSARRFSDYLKTEVIKSYIDV